MSKPELTQSYIDNSLVENDSNWIALVNAIKKAGIYVAIGASERIGDKLHMSQIFWSPEGEKLIHRQSFAHQSSNVISGVMVMLTDSR